MSTVAKTETPRGEYDLSDFFKDFVDFTKSLTEGMLRQLPDESDRAAFTPMGESLNNQVQEITAYLTDLHKERPAQKVREHKEMLRLNGIKKLAEAGISLAKDLSSTHAKFNIGGIFDLLKKVLRKLFPKLAEKFEWILELLNELKNFILGFGSSKLNATLARAHIDYMDQLTSLAKLEKAGMASSAENVDDDD
jgi:uncharacterized protein YdhG (YjbR/CyaY superfamily)